MSDSTFKKVNVNVNNIDDSVPRVNRTQKVSIGLDVSSFSDPISLEIKCQLAPTPLSPYQTETIERDRCKFQRPRKKQKNILGAVSEVQSGKQTLPKKQNRKGTRCESQTPMIRRIQGLLPAFGQASYKGQHGKVAIIGGSKMYTGAPYFAGIATLRAGADLCSVFCCEEAAGPIKSYSPELMVNPVLVSSEQLDKAGIQSKDEREKRIREAVGQVEKMLPRLHSLVIGPGLGRDEVTLEITARIIKQAKALALPLVIDADGLYLLLSRLDLIQGYEQCVLTPNAMEFERLWRARLPHEEVPAMSVQVDDAFKTVMKENRRVNTALMLNTEEKNALHPRKRKPDHDDGADDNRAGSDDRGHSTGGNDVTSGLCSADDVPAVRCVQTLAQAMGGVTIMKKGLVDIISNGHTSFYSCKQGSPRRCGGQGDLTAGFLGLFSHWACYAEREKRSKGKEREEKGEGRKGMDTDSAGSHQDSGSSVADAGTQTAREALEKVQAQYNQLPPTIVSAYAASFLTRCCAERAFQKNHRSMLASDMIASIPHVLQARFPPVDTQNRDFEF